MIEKYLEIYLEILWEYRRAIEKRAIEIDTAKTSEEYHAGYVHGLEVAGKLAEIYLKGGDKNG